MTFDKERLEEIAHDPKGSGLEMDLAKALLVANLQIDAMRPVVEAAIAYEVDQETWDRLSSAIDAYKARCPEKRNAEAIWKCAHCGSRRMSTVLYDGVSHCLDCCNNTKV